MVLAVYWSGAMVMTKAGAPRSGAETRDGIFSPFLKDTVTDSDPHPAEAQPIPKTTAAVHAKWAGTLQA